jgi:hypothetical protein
MSCRCHLTPFICDGQDLAKGAGVIPPYREQGVPSRPTDEYNPKRCKKRRSNDCFEKCLLKKWGEPRPTYGIPYGVDCQEYDDGVNNKCFIEYLGKDKWTK